MLATFWTLAGPKRPGPHPSVSPWPATERIRAAGAAGFGGFGFMDEDLAHWLAEEGAAAIAGAVTGAGITDGEIELKGAWWSDDDALFARYADHLAVASGFGFTVAKVFAIAPEPIADEAFVRGLTRLGELAGRHGVRVGLEFVPFSRVPSLADALRIVTAVDAAPVGLTLDSWHVVRSGTDLRAIAALPGDLVVRVELNDASAAPRHPDAATDSIDHRVPIGQGDFPITEFVAAVLQTGYRGQFGVEILGERQRGLPLAEAARESFETTAAAVAAAEEGLR